MIIPQGGRFGGWAFFAKDGTAKFVYNVLGIREFATEATSAIPAGTHQVRMEFAHTTAAGLPRAGPSPCTTTGPSSAAAASRPPNP